MKKESKSPNLNIPNSIKQWFEENHGTEISIGIGAQKRYLQNLDSSKNPDVSCKDVNGKIGLSDYWRLLNNQPHEFVYTEKCGRQNFNIASV